MTVDEAWDHIEDWLRANAPATHAELPPPAGADGIRAAQDAIGCAFPDGLTASPAWRGTTGRAGSFFRPFTGSTAPA
ncbi:hypothetical protein [Streptomyces cyaneofuscatus]|uniref:hypothetical protein n=1 Tax=Streptomyces cyaneofuscatus TaxID=66883 RepID=UPI003649AC1F